MYSVTYIPISNIIKEKDSEFEPLKPNEFEELVNSIKEVGILQPVIVYKSDSDNKDLCTLYAGYNRLKAAKEAGLQEIPCIIAENKYDAINIEFDTDIFRRHLSEQQRNKYIIMREKKKDEHLKKIVIQEIYQLYERGIINNNTLRAISKLPADVQKMMYDSSKHFPDTNNTEIIEHYETQIEELKNKISEIENNAIPIEKLKKDVEKRLKDKEKEIADKYRGESQEKIKMLIEEARAEIHEEYKADIEELTRNLRDMSKAKAEAQKQIELLKDEIIKLKNKENEARAINQKIRDELIVAKKTLQATANPDLVSERIEITVKDLIRIYEIMVLIGQEAFMEKKNTIQEKITQIHEIATEMAEYFSNT